MIFFAVKILFYAFLTGFNWCYFLFMDETGYFKAYHLFMACFFTVTLVRLFLTEDKTDA